MKTKQEMTPVQCKEHMDELLELQQEEGELRRKAEKAAEVHKEAKAKHELKEKEIMDHLAALNQDLPLFDNTEDIPWPFPVPDETKKATLADVAADPGVMGLSIGIVKQVREVMGCYTLGALQAKYKAAETLSQDHADKAKKDMAKLLGPSQALKILRAIASFTGNRSRKAQAAKKKVKAEDVTVPSESTGRMIPTEKATPPTDYRDTLCADLDELTPLQAKTLNQFDLNTLGKALDRLDTFNKEKPENPPKDYLAKRLAMSLGVKDSTAGEIIKGLYAAEEKYLTGVK